jgi:hypothetical protein
VLWLQVAAAAAAQQARLCHLTDHHDPDCPVDGGVQAEGGARRGAAGGGI